jgi:hypothetical protein
MTPRPADSQVRFDGPDGFDDDVAVEEDVGIERLFCVDAATLRSSAR